MELNRFVFPAPKKSYTTEHKRLIIIPKFDLDELTEKVKESTKVSQCESIFSILFHFAFTGVEKVRFSEFVYAPIDTF